MHTHFGEAATPSAGHLLTPVGHADYPLDSLTNSSEAAVYVAGCHMHLIFSSMASRSQCGVSFARQRSLKLSCRMWRGVIAAAVYVPMVDGDVFVQDKYFSLKEARQQVQALFEEVEAIGAPRSSTSMQYNTRFGARTDTE